MLSVACVVVWGDGPVPSIVCALLEGPVSTRPVHILFTHRDLDTGIAVPAVTRIDAAVTARRRPDNW